MLSWSYAANLSCFGEDTSVTSCGRSYKTVQEMLDTTLKRESDHKWQKINWQTNAPAALRQAQQENKPIFILFLVNERKYLSKQCGQT
jgi:hypothetical protein